MRSEAAVELLRRVTDTGYFGLYGLLGDGNLRAYDWDKMSAELSGPTRDCWRFFLLGGGLKPAQARALLGARSLDFLGGHGLTTETPEGISLGTLSLITYGSQPFFIDRDPNSRAYLGDDTKALMTMLPEVRGGSCLALFPGCGAAALPLVRRGLDQFSFGWGRFDRRVLSANLELNGLSTAPQFLSGRPTRSRRGGKAGPAPSPAYDLIMAACPSTFEPPGVKMPPMIAGGRDGLDRVREVLEHARRTLAPEGTVLLTFLFYSASDIKVMRAGLAEFLDPWRMDYRALLCSKHALEPGVPVFNMLLGSAAGTQPARAEALARKMLRYVSRAKLEAAYLVKAALFATRGKGGRQILNYSDLYYGGWTF